MGFFSCHSTLCYIRVSDCAYVLGGWWIPVLYSPTVVGQNKTGAVYLHYINFFTFLLLPPYLHIGSLFSYFWSHHKGFQLAVFWGISHSGTLSLVCMYAVQTCLLQFNLKQNIILIFECFSFSAMWQSFSFIKWM